MKMTGRSEFNRE